MAKKKTPRDSMAMLEVLRRTVSESVRRESPDLTARQLAVMMTVYLTPEPHTVRGLAAALNISKPVVTRALDRLSALDFIRRKKDASDGRNVLVVPTVNGSVYLRELGDIATAASRGK